MEGVGLSIPEVAGRQRAGNDPATDALIARMSVGPGAVRASVIDVLVRSLKAAGIWAKLDVLHVIAAHDAQAARLNWVGTGYTLVPVNSPVFTTDRGYAGDGSTSYLSTGWAPSAGVQYQQDNASFGVWLNAGTDTGSSTVIGCNEAGTKLVTVAPRTTGNQITARINGSAATNFGSGFTTRLGLTAVSRSASNMVDAWRNGASAGASGSAASTGRPNQPFYLGGYNFGGTFMNPIDNRHAAFFAGGGLSGGEQAALYSALAAYMTAVGA